jgi:hypothetical protein
LTPVVVVVVGGCVCACIDSPLLSRVQIKVTLSTKNAALIERASTQLSAILTVVNSTTAAASASSSSSAAASTTTADVVMSSSPSSPCASASASASTSASASSSSSIGSGMNIDSTGSSASSFARPASSTSSSLPLASSSALTSSPSGSDGGLVRIISADYQPNDLSTVPEYNLADIRPALRDLLEETKVGAAVLVDGLYLREL